MPDDTMMQQNSRGVSLCPGIYCDCITLLIILPNIFSPEKAANMIAEVDCNDPTTSRVKMKMVGYATEKSCNSGVVAAWVEEL